MGLDGRLGDAEFVGDLLVQQALRQHHQHADLLRRQRSEPARQRARLRVRLRVAGRNPAASIGRRRAPARSRRASSRVEFDLGMKPAAPNSRQWRITARSSLPDTMTTGVDGPLGRAGTAGPKIRARRACVRSSSTRSVSGGASSAAAMLSKSCATAISAPGDGAEHRLAQAPDDQRMIVGDQNPHRLAQSHLLLAAVPAGRLLDHRRNRMSLSRLRHRRKSIFDRWRHPKAVRRSGEAPRRARCAAAIADVERSQRRPDRNPHARVAPRRDICRARPPIRVRPAGCRRARKRNPTARVSPLVVSSTSRRPRARAPRLESAHESWRAIDTALRDSPCPARRNRLSPNAKAGRLDDRRVDAEAGAGAQHRAGVLRDVGLVEGEQERRGGMVGS